MFVRQKGLKVEKYGFSADFIDISTQQLDSLMNQSHKILYKTFNSIRLY